jgi:hypothetical protein
MNFPHLMQSMFRCMRGSRSGIAGMDDRGIEFPEIVSMRIHHA